MKMLFDAFDASEIDTWARRADAPPKLPALIRLLVQETIENPSPLVDMPSGSSVWNRGWDGLLSVQCGNTWVPTGNSAWEMSCNKYPSTQATKNYAKRSRNPLGEDVDATTFVFVTPRRWAAKRRWMKERQDGPWAGVRALDADDLVAWLEQAPKVSTWFAGLIRKSSSVPTEEGLEGINRIEKKLSEVHAMVSPTTGRMVVQTEPAQGASPAGSGNDDLVKKIDFARDLIDAGLISSARVELEPLTSQAGAIPVELEFRILTNLGACALAEEDFEGARAFLEEAHRLQPDNTKAIANAALAAALGKNFERAIALALKARTRDPQVSQATAVLMEAYFEASQDDLLEELVASDEWITCDKQCRLTLARIRMQQSRFEESATLCRSLINDDCQDPIAQLTLSETLLNHSDSESLAIGLTEESHWHGWVGRRTPRPPRSISSRLTSWRRSAGAH